MANFALVDENNIVRTVIGVSNDDCGGGNYPESEPIGQAFIGGVHPLGLNLDGRWLQTSFSASFRSRYAGIGYTYHPAADVFIPPMAPEVPNA